MSAMHRRKSSETRQWWCATWALGALVVGAAGCGEPNVTLDGAVSGDLSTSSDLAVSLDATAGVEALFTVVGCAQLTIVDGQIDCRGPAPLSLTFVPLTSGVSTAAWTFVGGVPNASAALSPTIAYSSVGVYEVGLAAGGAGGTVSASGMVEVTAGGTGAPCLTDQDCDGNQSLRCWCAGGACPGALAAGFCTRPCDTTTCGSGQLCVDLTRGLVAPVSADEWQRPDGGLCPVDGGLCRLDGGLDGGYRPRFEDLGAADLALADGGVWRSVVCVPACSVTADCRAGLSCRALPLVAPPVVAEPWKLGCFADLLGDVGSSCVAPDGELDPGMCLSGRCDALGARGLCTADCSLAACPTGSGCITFRDEPDNALCLRHCSASTPCADPLLSCVSAGGGGGLAVSTATGERPGQMYCAPKPCAMASDCPGGSCQLAAGASFCRH